jgi:superfamily II DNA or RNA helicase
MKNIYTKDRVKLGSAGLILNLEAGQGKSYLSAYLVSLINKKTLLILHTTALIEQWVKVFNRCIPNASIGYYYAKKKIFGDIMIMIVDSARKDKFTFELKDCTFNKDEAMNAEITDETISWPAIDFYNMFGMTIYDECHEYANKSDSKVFKFAQTPYMIGLSATPDENANKFDCMYWWEIGPVLNADKLVGYQSTKEDFKADVYRIMYYGNSDYTKVLINEITQLVSVSSTINMICEKMIHENIKFIIDRLTLNTFFRIITINKLFNEWFINLF